MFCVRCGRPTEGEKIVCDECAAKEAAKKQPAPVVEEKPAPVLEETPVPVLEPKAPEAPAFTVNTNIPQPPKKKKGAVGLIIVAVLLVAAIVAAILCWPMIQDTFARADNDDDTLETTETTDAAFQTGAAVEALGAAYGTFLENLKNPVTTGDCTVSLMLGDNLVSLLETALASQNVELDVSWLESVALDLQTGMEGGSYGVDMGLLLNDTDLLTLSVFMDVAEGMLYMGVPEVNDTYLSVSMSDYMDFNPSILTTAMEMPAEMAATLAEELPDQKAFEAALEKYIDLIVENLPEGEEEKETFEVAGISQELTVTTRKLTEQDALDLVVAVLEAAKDDQTVEQFITAVCNYTNSYNAMTAELSGYEYIDELNPSEVIAAIPDIIAELKSIETDDSEVTLVLYADKAGNLCGVSLEDIDGELLMDCISVTDGGTTALQVKLPDGIQINGQIGEENAEFTLIINDEPMLSVRTEITADCTVISLVPSAVLLEELSYDYSILSMASTANPELQLKVYDDGVELNIILNGEVFAGLGLYADGNTSYVPAKPDNFISVEDEAGLMTWLSELNFSGVIQSLKDAGVPAELVDGIMSSLMQGWTGSQGSEAETPNVESAIIPAA